MQSNPLDRHLYDREGEVFPCVGEPLTIDGPAGRIEAITSCPEHQFTSRAVAVICHPHPLYGGTMQNKVVHYLAKSFNDLGLRALRFNFRGVGGSAGSYADGVGEADDLRAVLDWLSERLPGAKVWLAGFSFGAYVALREATHAGVEQLVTVAPPVNFFDFSALRTPDCPWLLIQGDQDEVVPAEQVLSWAHGLSPAPEIIAMPDVDHFFHGHLNSLRELLLERLRPAAEALAR